MKILPVLILSLLSLASSRAQDDPLRVGIIGLDTSHVPAFTKLLNREDEEFEGIRVVAGYPGGTDMPASRDRVEKFTEEVRGMGLEIVPTIPALLEKVDVVLLESVDGRIHLEEAAQVIAAGKPLFIDKPLAGSLADAVAIALLAERKGVPFFSSSSLRYGRGTRELRESGEAGEILGATTWGPCSYQKGTPDFFFYGIHGIELLYTLMGGGCESVVRSKGDSQDVVTGQWRDGRIGTFRGIRKGKSGYGAMVFGADAVVRIDEPGGYEALCREIARFFHSGEPPVKPEETLEIFAFMEAADETLRQDGRPVKLGDVMEKARAEAEAKLAEMTN